MSNHVMRAKLEVVAVLPFGNPVVSEQVTFRGVCKSDGYPADGSDENNSFAKWSPSVDQNFTIANPNLFGQFKPGDQFYADYTRVPKQTVVE